MAEYREQVLKQKMLNDMYKKEREKEGDINLKSDEKDKELSLIKRMEKKPDRLEGETDEDYETRLNQWETRIGIKVKEDTAKERDILLKNFSKIMSPAEAGEMMSYPQITEENIKKLNQHWKSFEEQIRKKYTSLDFDILEEFILKYIETVDNGPLEGTNLNLELKRGFLMMRDKLDNITVGLEEKAEDLITQFKQSNDKVSFELQTKLGQLLIALQRNNIDLINQKASEIEQTIGQAQRLSSRQMSNNTRNIIAQTTALVGKVRNDINNVKLNILKLNNNQQQVLQDIATTNTNLTSIERTLLRAIANNEATITSSEVNIINQLASTNDKLTSVQRSLLSEIIQSQLEARQSRQEMRGSMDKIIKQSVDNYGNILDAINPPEFFEARDDFYDPEQTQLDERNVSQRQIELERALAEAETPLYEPDMSEALSPNRSISTKLYTIDEITQQFRRNRTLFDSIKTKLTLVQGREDMLIRARQYSQQIPQGQTFFRRFEDKIYRQDNPFTIENIDIERYIIPLIAYERNTYIENNPRVKANDRVKNASVNQGSRPIFGAGSKTIMNTVGPLFGKNILLGSGLGQRLYTPSDIGQNIRSYEPEETNNIIFGRYELDGYKLNDNNLLITYHNTSMNRVKYFPQKIVSDEMKDLINYISSKKKYNDKLFNLLDDDEKLLFKNMFIKSGLSKMLNVKIFDDNTKQAKKDYENMKEKYYIIEGEINAGNDNNQLVRELNEITKQLKKQIVYMNKIGLLGLKESNNLILSL